MNPKNILEKFNKIPFEKKRIYFCSLFLFVELLILSATLLISHVSEHILIGAGIGYISILLFMPLIKKPIFTLGWYTGTLYYLGREIRDYEKETGGENTGNFDIGGFFGPFFGNMITFFISYLIYRDFNKLYNNDNNNESNSISRV